MVAIGVEQGTNLVMVETKVVVPIFVWVVVVGTGPYTVVVTGDGGGIVVGGGLPPVPVPGPKGGSGFPVPGGYGWPVPGFDPPVGSGTGFV